MMKINGFNGTNTQTGAIGMAQTNDSVSKNIQNQIANAQQKLQDEIKKGTDANEALKKVTGTYGRFTEEQGAVKHIDPRHE